MASETSQGAEAGEGADAQADLPADAPVLYWLISMLPRAHDVPPAGRHKIQTDTWDDEGSEWHVKLNGSGAPTARIIDPIGDEWPSPSQTPFHAGTFLVLVDTGDGQEAVCCVHPTHIQSFTDPGDQQAATAWETAAIRAVRERLEAVGLEATEDGPGISDLPPARELVAAHQRWAFDQADDPGGEGA